MIISFGSIETEKIWNVVRSKKIPPEVQKVGRRKLRMINNSIDINDLRIQNYSPPLDNLLSKIRLISFPGHGRERKIMQPSHTTVPVCYNPGIDVACGYYKIPYTI